MDNIQVPPGAIPVDQFESAPIPVPATPASTSSPEQKLTAAGAIPVDEFESQEDAFGSTGQQAIAGLEGIAQGVAGPLAPAAERVMGVSPEAIRGRAQANPWTHGVGEATGLVGSMFVPGGQASVLAKVGKAAEGVAGLAKVAEGASVAHRVGSIAVRNAAEMAVFQGGDEVAKQILKDPDASAQSALTNIGLAAMTGGVLGAGAGASKELWNATVGPKLEKTLSGLSDYLNGGGRLAMPQELENAQKTLGIELSPAMRAGISGDPKAAMIFNELREAQNPQIMADIAKLQQASSEAVMNSLGVDAADVIDYNAADLGHKMRNVFMDEYKAKYGPIAEALNRRDEMAAILPVSDEAKLKLYGNLLETGMKDFGTDSPFYDMYHEYGNRILAKNTIGELDKLTTEIQRSARNIANDPNKKLALNKIATALKDFKEEQIMGSAAEADQALASAGQVSGMPRVGHPEDAFNRFKPLAADLIADRRATNQMYRDFAEMSDKLGFHLGIGDFRGAGSLMEKLADKRSAEQILTAFSPKGDADIIPFLQKHFPETLQVVKENEIKKILKPAILSAKGDNPIDIKKLSSIIEKGLAGENQYIRFAMSPEALEKIAAADRLVHSLPAMKSSGTAGWMTKMYKHMPASAMAAIGWLMGHNPISGFLAGHLAQYIGREVPDAIRLSMLKFLGSEQPVQAKGFKAMVDFMADTYKGAQKLEKGAKYVFMPLASAVISEPSQKDLDKLDKYVANTQSNPQPLVQGMTNNSAVGYYMPNHQGAIAQTASQALSYLASIKPQPFKPGPLDEKIEPTDAEMARYNRALTIAQQPAMVYEHIKNGTLLPTDIIDLRNMYPQLYQQMAQKLTAQMIDKTADHSLVPYKTKMALSLFLGQPLDHSMTAQSIMTAQPTAAQQAQKEVAAQPVKHSMSKLGKNNKDYLTPNQASEQRKSNRG